ncbi:MAG: hypothetical protein JWP25_6013 [Bradyrhizobium sp.]|nr:hypothetical protein [Bradyrhizobium sp.]
MALCCCVRIPDRWEMRIAAYGTPMRVKLMWVRSQPIPLNFSLESTSVRGGVRAETHLHGKQVHREAQLALKSKAPRERR